MKNKVAFAVTNNIINDARVLRHAKTLSQTGYDVTIIALRTGKEPELEKYFGVKIKRIQPFVIRKNWKKFIDIIKYMINLFSYGNGTQKKIYDALINENADIYHANDLDTLLPCYKAAITKKAKLIFDSHEIFPEVMNQMKKKIFSPIIVILAKKYWQYIEKKYINKANAIMTVSFDFAKYFSLKYNIKKPSVVLNVPIINFDDNKTINLHEILNIPNNKKIIAYHGIFAPGRGIIETIRSIKYLPQDYVLVLLGYGSLEKEINRIAQTDNITDRLFILGPIPNKKMIYYLRSINIGLVPTVPINLSKKLTIPNKLFDLMAAGVPIVTSPLPGPEKIVIENELGKVFKNFEPKEIAKTIIEVTESEKFDQYKKNCLKASIDRYNWNIESKKLIEIYKKLL